MSLFGNLADHSTVMSGRSAYLLLDFGQEISGGIRIITSEAEKRRHVAYRIRRIAGEACALLDEKTQEMTSRLCGCHMRKIRCLS